MESGEDEWRADTDAALPTATLAASTGDKVDAAAEGFAARSKQIRRINGNEVSGKVGAEGSLWRVRR